MSQLPPAPAPQQPGLDTLKVRGRLRGVWLALWLAGAAVVRCDSASMEIHRRTHSGRTESCCHSFCSWRR